MVPTRKHFRTAYQDWGRASPFFLPSTARRKGVSSVEGTSTLLGRRFADQARNGTIHVLLVPIPPPPRPLAA